jgi:hypothetical protein
MLLPNNKLVQTIAKENGVTVRLSVQLPQGTFSGTVLTSTMSRAAQVRGVLDRDTGTGIGYFLSPAGSGLILLEP